MKSTNLFQVVKSCGGKDWNTTGKWFAFTLVVGSLPLLAGLVILSIASDQPIEIREFVVHGEFAIYSASLIAGATRLIARDPDGAAPFVHREMFVLAALAILFFSIATYVVLKMIALLGVPRSVNTDFVMNTSYFLVGASLVFSFVVFLLDQQRVSFSLRDIRARQMQQLTEEFDHLGAQ